MKSKNGVILRLTLAIIFGILFAKYSTLALSTFALSASLGLVACILFHLFNKNAFSSKLILLISAFLLGGFSYHVHIERNLKNHYSYSVNSKVETIISFRVERILKPSKKYFRYIVKISSINKKHAQGKVILYLNKEAELELNHSIHYVTVASFLEIQASKNPYQFNYKDYLNNQNISHSIYPKIGTIKILNKDPVNLKTRLFQLRTQLKNKVHKTFINRNTHAVIDALLLGDKFSLDQELYEKYAFSGGIHFLAVSGLHVGIIAYLISFLLKPLLLLKKGDYIKLVVVTLLLWLYAIYTGNSSSVVRAVSMFSIYTFAYLINREQELIDIILVSIFLLLLIHPNYLFDIGFQLSYCAIFGIIMINPLFNKLYAPKNYFQKILWRTFTVSISAQLGVLPLSLFYFHYFPMLFLVTNLIILPFLGFIICFGIVVLVLLSFNVEAKIVFFWYQKLIFTLNKSVTWIANKDAFVLKNISFNLVLLLVSYSILYFLIAFLHYKKFKSFFLLLISILIFQIAYTVSKTNAHKSEFVVFHASKETIIAKQYHKQLLVYSDTMDTDIIANYSTGNFIEKVKYKSLANVLNYNETKILILDSLGIYKGISFNPDIIILTQSPKVNLERLIEAHKPSIIIADGSNYKTYVARWKKTCKKKKLPFHSTYEKGAYIINE